MQADIVLKVRPTVAAHPEGKFTDLPFVSETPKGLCYWQVSPSGDYENDFLIGQRYALEAVALCRVQGHHQLLSYILAAIGKVNSGLEAGFYYAVAGFAAEGVCHG